MSGPSLRPNAMDIDATPTTKPCQWTSIPPYTGDLDRPALKQTKIASRLRGNASIASAKATWHAIAHRRRSSSSDDPINPDPDPIRNDPDIGNHLPDRTKASKRSSTDRPSPLKGLESPINRANTPHASARLP